MKTKLLIEQHIHGAFGIDFNKANADDIVFVARKLLQYGIGGFFPTLVTDSLDVIKNQIDVIKTASESLSFDCAKILGIHLEGIFINPEKKGIHNPKYILPLTKENYLKIEDPFIKIITLAPELDADLIDYLKLNSSVKIQAGHTLAHELNMCDGVTHLFNAMGGIHHRNPSTALAACMDDDIYTEVIADGFHLSDDILSLIFKVKPEDKVILISDSLPVSHSNLKEVEFAGEKIYYDGFKAVSKDGTIAGSSLLLPDIIKILNSKGLFNPKFIDNIYEYNNIEYLGDVVWDDDFNIVSISIKNK